MLADAVLALGGSLVIAELVGSIGAFREYIFVPACVVAGLIAGRLAGPRRTLFPENAGSSGGGERVKTIPLILAAFVVGIVTTLWVAGTIVAWQSGPPDVDTQYYHLPHAARFVQEGSLTQLQYVIPGDASPYHPSNSELFHAIGMLVLRSDVLSPALNLGWLALALAAAAVAGRRLGEGSAALAGVALLLATPLMVRTQAGSAQNDVVGLALFLSSCALLLSPPRTPASAAIAAIAAGLALGTKLSFVAPVLVLTLVVLVPAFRGDRRVRSVAAWVVPLGVTSVFWYARNLFRVGNPVPSLRLGIGDAGLPRPPMALVDRFGYSVADYAFDMDIWKRVFIPGFAHAFGRMWPVLAVAVLAGTMVTLIRSRTATVRGLALTVLLSGLAYAFTPTTAFGLRGQPLFFVENLRYAAPAIVLGLVLLAAVPAVRRWPWLATAIAALSVLGIAGFASTPGRLGAIAAIFLGVCGGIVVAFFGIRRTRVPVAALALVLIASIGLSYLLQRGYEERRYTAHGRYAAHSSRDPAPYLWAQGVRRARIGVAGMFVQYPLYGPDLSNQVEYVGDLLPNGSFEDYRTCRSWTEALASGRYDYVVVSAPFPDTPIPPQAAWTRRIPGVKEIVRGHGTVVFRVRGEPLLTGCDS